MTEEQSNEQNNEQKNASRPYAIGCGSIFLLTIVFIVLKAFGVLSWSWLWVFSPLWLCAAAIFALVLAAFISGFFKR